ncbi:MAG: radical SAM protein [Candidatus Aenigmatarchaeota archaeon]
MKVVLINPNIVTQKNDFFGTGIPYMPITLAYAASYLRKKGHEISVIDAFGENPWKLRKIDDKYIQGLDTNEIIKKIDKNTEIICIYAGLVVTHEINLEIIKNIRKKFNIPIVVIENTQSVVAYSLKNIFIDFFNYGANYVITGEPEIRLEKLLNCLEKKKSLKTIDGLIFKKDGKIIINKKKSFIKDLDALPFPAWDLFPLENYWKLGYAHAPLSSKKYLPMLTSRGCIYDCEFCIIPEMNKRRWRFRSPENIVDEILYWNKTYGIREFHIEDLNPTISKKRIIDLSKLIIRKKINIKWKIAAGTKIEHIDKNTLKWMKKSGCNYISFSPESGSKNVLELMHKPFDHLYGLEIVKKMKNNKIKTQACFVIGFPGENEKDLNETKRYIKKLTKNGLDEVAIFIMTPIPGSRQYGKISGYKKIDQLTFTPIWRSDFKKLNDFRIKIYIKFILWKLIYNPLSLFRQFISLLIGRYETKSEMTIIRILKMNCGRWFR